jgi:hypothetical protein
MISTNIWWMMLGYMTSSIVARIDAKSYDTIMYPVFMFACISCILILRKLEK